MQTTTQAPKNNINWAELFFAAELNHEDFASTRIFTAKSEFIEKAKEQAIDVIMNTHQMLSDYYIKEVAMNLIQTQLVRVYEYAKVVGDKISVCINADLDDDDTNFKVLDMVYGAIDNGGEWISTTPLSWDILDLPELALHN